MIGAVTPSCWQLETADTKKGVTRMLRKLALALAAGGAVASSPGHAASATGTATVNILKAVTLTKTADLDFGKIAPGASSTMARVNIDGTRVCSFGLTCIGKASAGAFDVTGSSGETVTVALDSTTVTLASGTSATMSVSLTLSAQQVTIVNGKGTVKVGGALTVGAQQPAGIYAGLFQVSVNYQ